MPRHGQKWQIALTSLDVKPNLLQEQPKIDSKHQVMLRLLQEPVFIKQMHKKIQNIQSGVALNVLFFYFHTML